VSSLAAVGIAAGLSACGNTQVTGAIGVGDVRAQNVITTPAPGEKEPATITQKAQCKNGVVGPTTVAKELYSTASVSEVKNFYTALAAQGQWYLRESSGSLLNYSKQQDNRYWQLHISLASSADGQYVVMLEAYNNGAHC